MNIKMFLRKFIIIYKFRIGVIHHNDPIVYIYRYRINENKILLHYTITMSKDKN